MNITAKFQIYCPYGLWGVDFLNIFRKFSILVAMTTNEIVGLGQKLCLVVVHSKNISEFFLPKYLQWDSNKCQFSFFPLQGNENFKLP